MFTAFLSRIGHGIMRKKDKSSDFSKFFREASSAQKKKVFLDVAKRASRDQLEIIQSVRMSH